MLELYFLGKTQILQDGVNISTHFRGKTIALICLLVLNRHQYLSREKIIAYLWPDSGEDAAKYNLRYNLWLIKKHIKNSPAEEPFLIIDKNHCGLNREYPLYCDILAVMNCDTQNSVSVDELGTLRELAFGDFMEGYYFNNCNELNEIIISKRTLLESYRVDILKRMAELYEEAGQGEACISALMEIMDIELYDETVALKILNIYERIGKRSAAILFFKTIQDRLAKQLGIHPSKELNDKFQELKAQSARLPDDNPLIAEREQYAVSNDRNTYGKTDLMIDMRAETMIDTKPGIMAEGLPESTAEAVSEATAETSSGAWIGIAANAVPDGAKSAAAERIPHAVKEDAENRQEQPEDLQAGRYHSRQDRIERHCLEQRLKITTSCIEGVQYFWMSDVARKLFFIGSGMLFDSLSPLQLSYLSCIQPCLQSGGRMGQAVPLSVSVPETEGTARALEVQIVNSFLCLVNNICRQHELEITIQEAGDLDPISAGVVKYLKSSQEEERKLEIILK